MDSSPLSPDVKTSISHVQRILLQTLNQLDGEKTLVWDMKQDLLKRVSLFTTQKDLVMHGAVRQVRLEPGYRTSTTYVVFFLNPRWDSVMEMCNFMDREDEDTLYVAIFFPTAEYVIREKLKEYDGGRYWNRLECVREIPIWWLPTEGDCLSMNESQVVSKLLLNGDWTYLHKCAVALQEVLGLIKRQIPIYSKGDWSRRIARILKGSKKEDESPEKLKINRLVIIDRWLDPLTPMLTQQTYSGELDELVGIDINGSLCPKAPEDENNNFSSDFKGLSLTDSVYSQIRDVHVSDIKDKFDEIMNEMRLDEITVEDFDNKSPAECKLLIKKLPKIQMRKTHWKTHVDLAVFLKEKREEMVEHMNCEHDLLFKDNSTPVSNLLNSWFEKTETDPYISDAIHDAVDLSSVLRLISIQSLVQGGLKASLLQTYRRLIYQSYGTEAVNKILKLQMMGLITEKREKVGEGIFRCDYPAFNFQHKKKSHGLIEETSKAPLYSAYNGYIPLLVQLLSDGERQHWTNWQKQGEENSFDEFRTAMFIVGGVTRAELGLIRQLPNVSLVLTTAVITGSSLIDSLTTV